MMPNIPPATGLISALGLSLVHFLWQGAAIAVALRLVLAFCHAPRARYGWSLAALAAMAAAPAATFWALTSGSAEPGAAAWAPLPVKASDPAWIWIVVAAWAAGASMLGLRATVEMVLIERLRRRAEPLPQWWAERCRALAHRAAVPLRVAFAQSRDVTGPIVAGMFRPIVLIPTAALTRMPVEQLKALILHELAHVRRFDPVANLFQTIVEILFFYHPATWWVSRTIRIEREHCCDDMAVTEIGDPALFVRALQTLAEMPPPPPAALAASGASLVERVRRLLAAERPSRKIDMRVLAACLVALTTLTVGWSAHVEARTERGPGTAAEATTARPSAADLDRSGPVVEAAIPADGQGRAEANAADRAVAPERAVARYRALAPERTVAGYDAAATAPVTGDDRQVTEREGEMGALNRRLGDANRRLGAAVQALGAASPSGGQQAASDYRAALDRYRAALSQYRETEATSRLVAAGRTSAGRAPGGQPADSGVSSADPHLTRALTATISSEQGTTIVDTSGPKILVSGAAQNVLFLINGQRSSRDALANIPAGRVVRLDAVVAGSPRARSFGARPDENVLNIVTEPPT